LPRCQPVVAESPAGANGIIATIAARAETSPRVPTV
jgi:hypothetical protein